MLSRSFEFGIAGPVVLLTIALAACSSGSVPTAAPTTTPAAPTTAPTAPTTAPTTAPSQSTAVITTSATPCPSPTEGESWQCSGFLPSGEHFAPGTYATLFEPGVTLTLDGYGEAYVDSPSWINVQYDHDDLSISLYRLDHLYDPKSPPTPAPELCDICTTGGKLIDPPKDFAAWLARLPGVKVLGSAKSMQVGGLDASQLDVRSTKGVPIGPLAGFNNGVGASIGGGGTPSRLIAMTVSGHQILIAMGHGSMERGQAFIDSIVWH